MKLIYFYHLSFNVNFLFIVFIGFNLYYDFSLYTEIYTWVLFNLNLLISELAVNISFC